MTDAEQELAELECEMNALVGLRNERVHTGQVIIDRANKDFDKAALPLSRKINALRESLEVKPSPTAKQTRYREPDPDWDPEDIAHYRELRRLESIRNPR